MSETIVVIGGSHAGGQVVASLREQGFAGSIVMISDEPHLPYHRPPLSKAYLKDPSGGLRFLRGDDFYEQNSIGVRLGQQVTAIDRDTKQVTLATGEAIAYSKLVLAMGARVRVPNVPGIDAEGVFFMRTADDSDQLHAALMNARKLAVIGGGFIGLEAAATARQLGKDVIVFEAADRLMGRAVAPAISEFFLNAHREVGIEIRLSTPFSKIEVQNGHAVGVTTNAGDTVDADVVLVGIGVIPNAEPAEAAGLTCQNGIVVDAHMRTSDEDIHAIGDCANFVFNKTGAPTRLESVQNATDQARTVARVLTGNPTDYADVPWFWSDQANLKLQMAGLGIGADRYVTRGDPADGKFSVAHIADNEVIAFDSVNAPGDHMVMRKLLGGSRLPTPEEIEDMSFDLKAFFKRAN